MFMHRPFFKARRPSNQQPGKHSRKHARLAVRDAAVYTCERLEQRRLLTTLVGGGVDATGTPQEAVYDYLDGNENAVKIALWGTITAEFLFLHTNPDNSTDLVGPVPPTTANKTAKAGADLFSIYVASASPTASISIAQITNTTTGLVGGFTSGSGNAITVNPAQGGDPIVVAPGGASGSVWLGGRLFHVNANGTIATTLTNGTPVLDVPLDTQVGVRPPTANGLLYAGLVTAPGVSLNRFLFGGEVTGIVSIGGSIQTFYAGEIWTGDATGLFVGDLPAGDLQYNFNVAGDLGNLITIGDIGGNGVVVSGVTTYETGFYLNVGGHVGQVKSEDSINGSFYDENLPTLKGAGTAQQSEEIDGPKPPAGSGESFFEGNAPDSGIGVTTIDGIELEDADAVEGIPSLSDNATFNQNTALNAQFLGTLFSSEFGHNAIQLEGTLDDTPMIAHDVDYYGVALGADQTVTATLTLPFSEIDLIGGRSDLDMGIFAPDDGIAADNNSLIASTYNAEGNGGRLDNQPVTFTTTDAGVYYFAVAYVGDVDFNGNPLLLVASQAYQLSITGVGNISVGAVAAVNNIGFPTGIGLNDTTGAVIADQSLRVDYGDLGALISTGGGDIVAGDNAGFANPITAKTGNIRVIQAGSIGSSTTAFVDQLAPDIDAAGNVGVIRTTIGEPAGGILALNPAFEDNITATGIELEEGLAISKAIGGSYQLVDCGGLFAANLVADAGIGTIRAQDVGSAITDAPVLHVNADNTGNDGIIGLIDVTGHPAPSPTNPDHFGLLGTGGPRIITGPNGNVRYMNIAPVVPIFNDDFFGGLLDEPITYAAGDAASLIDDSGTPFTITPSRGTTIDSTDPTTGDSIATTSTGDALTLQTYGIEDKGGVVVISVTVDPGSVTVTDTTAGTTATTAGGGATSISVDTSANGTNDINASVDFGAINMIGNGTTLAFAPSSRTFTVEPGSVDDSATFNCKIPINVYNYAVTDAAGALAGATNVLNHTTGEIVNFDAESVEMLEADTLGVAKSYVGAPVSGAAIVSDVFPFHNQRTMIQIGSGTVTTFNGVPVTTSDAETIESTGSLGNILVDGTIGSILPDMGVTKIKGTSQGITGPIYAIGSITSDTLGNILSVNVGNGLGYSGSGNYAMTGIFADNYIGTITNQNGSNIRGDIVASGIAGGIPAVVIISPITGLPEPTKTSPGTYIGAISLSDGGSIIGAEIFTSSTIAQAIQSTATVGGYLITDPNPTTVGNGGAVLYAIGSISTSGDGGIIGAFILAGGVNSISVTGGFGIITSEIESLNSDVIGSIKADGYGIRSTFITGQNSVNTIVATGNGKELPITDFSLAVRQSESGAVTDAYSGLPLDIFDDLDEFLGTGGKRITRKGSTEAGVIADTEITGTYALGSITAWRMVGHPLTLAEEETETPQQELEQAHDDTPLMTINIANNIGTIAIAENTTDTTVTTGTLKSFSSGNNVVGSVFTVAGAIGSFTGGFINGSTYINTQGPDGTILYLATTAGLNASINSSESVGEILVGTDLGSTNITIGGNLDELYVKRNVLKGADVVVGRKLNTLVIRHNLLGGSTIQARQINSKSIGGVANGNIIIVPASP